MRTISVLSALVAATLGGESAFAGAWTRSPGSGFTAQDFIYLRTDRDTETGADRFEQATISTYVEYGLIEDLTVGLKLEQSGRIDSGAVGDLTGRAGVFARALFWRGEAGDVASFEAGAEAPVSGFQSPAALVGDTSIGLRGTVAYGRGFTSDYGNGWLEASLGYTHFIGGRAGEVKLDLTAGIRSDEYWVAIAQVFSTFGLRNARTEADPDFDAVKLKLSAGRKIVDDATVLIGLSRDVYARGAQKGWEVSLTIWSEFSFDFGLGE